MSDGFVVDRKGAELTITINPKGAATMILGGIGTLAMYSILLLIVYKLFTSGQDMEGTRYAIGVTGILAFTAMYFFAARALLRRWTHQEILNINGQKFTLTDKYIFSETQREFKVNEITEISLADSPPVTPHPLETVSSVEIGFGGREALVQQVISDGSIQLLCGNMAIRFGKGLPSWDVEEILEILNPYFGAGVAKVAPKRKHRIE